MYYEVWEEDTDDERCYRVTIGAEVVADALPSKAAVAHRILDHCGGRWQSVMVVDRSTVGPPLDAIFVELSPDG